MSNRQTNIRTVDSLNGIPGDCVSEDVATELLLRVVQSMGYGALSDEAIEALAAAHKEMDDSRGR